MAASRSDDRQVNIEIKQLSGDVIHTIENIVADASIGHLKARLRQSNIDFALWRFIVIGPKKFDMADDYTTFMLTKAVRQAMADTEEGKAKIEAMVVIAE